MKKYIRAIICLCFTNFKFLLIKIFHFKKFKFKAMSICSPFSEIDLAGGELHLGSSFKMRTNCHIRTRKNAKITIGDNTSLNYGNVIISHENITIGDNCQFAPNVLIYDHDHDYKAENGIKSMKYKTAPVIIGSNVWIGANTIVLRGTIIGDNCVIAAGSIVKGNVASNSMFLQKRNILIREIYANEK